jgi:hypothetical protein
MKPAMPNTSYSHVCHPTYVQQLPVAFGTCFHQGGWFLIDLNALASNQPKYHKMMATMSATHKPGTTQPGQEGGGPRLNNISSTKQLVAGSWPLQKEVGMVHLFWATQPQTTNNNSCYTETQAT